MDPRGAAEAMQARSRAPSPPIFIPRPRSDSYDEVDERQAFAAEDSYRTWMLYNRITSKTGLKIPTPDEGRFKAWEDRRRSRSPPLAASPTPGAFLEPSSLMFVMD